MSETSVAKEIFHSRTIIKPDSILYNYEKKPIASDDVYLMSHYQWKIYPFREAIQLHREYFHPTIFNVPDALVNIYIELNMQVNFTNSSKEFLFDYLLEHFVIE